MHNIYSRRHFGHFMKQGEQRSQNWVNIIIKTLEGGFILKRFAARANKWAHFPQQNHFVLTSIRWCSHQGALLLLELYLLTFRCCEINNSTNHVLRSNLTICLVNNTVFQLRSFDSETFNWSWSGLSLILPGFGPIKLYLIESFK